MLAKIAKRKGLALGVRLKLHNYPTSWRPTKFEIAEMLIVGPKYYPFFYSEDDPESIERWRERFRL